MSKSVLHPNTLSIAHSELAAEWHPAKNGDLTAADVSSGSGKKVWWQCKEGHEWQAAIYSRATGIRCPYCSGRLITPGVNDLATVNPSLAAEWHPMKNGDFSPNNAGPRSHKIVWWLGPCGHEWEETISNRSKGNGCPYCAGRRVLPGFNDLATTHPQIAAEWHPTKNGNQTPQGITKGSSKKVWWICARGHEWQIQPNTRTSKKSGCPICAKESQSSFPEQTIFYYFKQIGKTYNRYLYDGDTEIDVYLPDFKFGVEFDGYFHQNEKARKRDARKNIALEEAGVTLIRVNGVKTLKECQDTDTIIFCKYSASNHAYLVDLISKLISRFNNITSSTVQIDVDIERDRIDIYNQYIESVKQNSLLYVYPEIAAEWHPTKNKSLTPLQVSKSSNKKVWWLGKCGHEWQANINTRSSGFGCPYCSGQKVLAGFNDLATTHPNLAAEWHPTKNGKLKSDAIIKGGKKKVWWLGACGHEWQASVADRKYQNSGCPYCSGRRVLSGFNDFATKMPDLIGEWHPTKNGSLMPNQVSYGSGKKVWWQCKEGHEWQATVSDRSMGNGCPTCAGRRVLPGFNDLATTHPQLAAEWHPTKNGNQTPQGITKGSSKKVWWICARGHEWQASPNVRSSNHRKCPVCCGQRVLAGYNDLATKNPSLAAEWHPTKNGSLMPTQVTSGTAKKVWWECEKGHEWQAAINSRSAGKGCPHCSGRVVTPGETDLATTHPKLAAEWHPTKNIPLTPENVMMGSHKRVWWKCSVCGHEWDAVVYSRSAGHGCPNCGRKGDPQKVNCNPRKLSIDIIKEPSVRLH